MSPLHVLWVALTYGASCFASVGASAVIIMRLTAPHRINWAHAFRYALMGAVIGATIGAEKSFCICPPSVYTSRDANAHSPS